MIDINTPRHLLIGALAFIQDKTIDLSIGIGQFRLWLMTDEELIKERNNIRDKYFKH